MHVVADEHVSQFPGQVTEHTLPVIPYPELQRLHTVPEVVAQLASLATHEVPEMIYPEAHAEQDEALEQTVQVVGQAIHKNVVAS